MITFDVERLGPWVAGRTGGKYFSGSGQAIGLHRNGELAAAVLYDSFNGRSVQMHVASDGSKSWMNKAFLLMAFDLPFNQWRVNKIIGLVDSTNHEAIRFDENIGFHLEHVVTDAGPEGDLLIYSMTRQQCRWIKD
ncbi:MAG: GNAT family N-acetyltransferase [Burkholderiales bacterium]|nr:GNAT family N-acetyltransferase [Burkholderiales bacterium]